MPNSTRLAQLGAVLALLCGVAALRIATTEPQHWGLPPASPTIVAVTSLVLLLSCVTVVVSPLGKLPLPLFAARHTDAIVVISALLLLVSGSWRELSAAMPSETVFVLLPDNWLFTTLIVIVIALRTVRLRRYNSRPVTPG